MKATIIATMLVLGLITGMLAQEKYELAVVGYRYDWNDGRQREVLVPQRRLDPQRPHEARVAAIPGVERGKLDDVFRQITSEERRPHA